MAVVVLIGVLLLVISVPTERKKNTQTNSADAKQTAILEEETAAGKTEEDRYTEDLETRLKELLESMDGVGKVNVMLTLEASRELVVEKDIPSGMENIVENDSSGGTRETVNSSQQESTVYTTDSDGTKTPYVKMARQPEVRGVTVVAEGGGNSMIQKNITEVIEALFGIDAHKIRVVKMK